MSEQLNLTTPVTPPTLAHWRVIRLVLDRQEQRVVVTLLGTNGERFTYEYGGSAALTMLNQLNTANLSVLSLERRVLARLVADGILSGTISGSPD